MNIYPPVKQQFDPENRVVMNAWNPPQTESQSLLFIDDALPMIFEVSNSIFLRVATPAKPLRKSSSKSFDVTTSY
jgi:hypothetical protein